ncbi:unnamed protein product [Darwinula stevensoni]|uniref:Ion transport domain-containing protein n=1 Tax=Darwinula stevensoni TaxID=69355 RepID=A0A7R8XAQ1_9CRUS|nr:unnamed protein product [Darwinula stevensoni]CAG0890864.1 unnamed protein product [Darwinula stevensoni]
MENHFAVRLEKEEPTMSSFEFRYWTGLEEEDLEDRIAQELLGTTGNGKSWEAPLLLAAARNQLSKVKAIIESGADVNARDPKGNTALHAAASLGHQACMEALIRAGADVDAANGDEERPLHGAASLAASDPVQILLEAGADVNAVNSRGETALHVSAGSGLRCFPVVKELIRRGIRVDERDIQGQTALHLACQLGEGGSGVVLHLLQHGADPNAEDADYNTPVMHAAVSKAEESIRHLTRFGARLNHVDATLTLATKFPDLTGKLLDRTVRQTMSDAGKLIEFDLSPFIAIGQSLKDSREMNTFWEFLEGGASNLLTHPVCARFLHKKWEKFRPFFYLNLIVYLTYALLLTATAVMKSYYERFREYTYCIRNKGDVEKCEEDLPTDSSLKPITDGLLITVSVFTAIILLRELAQIAARKWAYFKEMENIVELLLIVLDGLLIANKMGSHFFNRDMGLHVCAITMLLVWLEVAMLVGKLPGQNLYVAMLTSVSKAFLKLLPTCICLIVGFGLSFHILFPDHFPDVPTSIYQAAVMMSGELEFSSIFFESERILKWTEHIISIVFVVLMSIVIMNLLTSLAVSVVLELAAREKVARLHQLVHLLFSMENVLKCSWLPFKSLAGSKCIDVMQSGRIQEKKRDLPDHIKEHVEEILTEMIEDDGKRQEEIEINKEHEDEEAKRMKRSSHMEEALSTIQRQIQQLMKHARR